jgi:glycosyltransferase involved in cell wall biosynthesis
VIEPGSPPSPSPPDGRARGGRHAALVGAVHVGKGALVFEQLVGEARKELATIRWSVIGGGDAGLLRRLARLPGVSIRGYYRAGTLPRLLQSLRVDVALLLSIVPESYGLTLDECWAAAVPVIAFEHGAVGERIRARGGGLAVPLGAGWAGVLAAVRDTLDGRSGGPAGGAPPPDVTAAARAYLRLYRELGLLPAESPSTS